MNHLLPAALVLIAACLLLAACSTSSPPPAARAPGRRFAERVPELGIDNAARVTPRILRGAQPTREGFAALKRMGVRTIINLREEHSEEPEVTALGFKHISIPMRADAFGSRAPTDRQIRTFLDAVSDPENQPVYFHCKKGRDRTGTMAAIYRMEVDGWSNGEALAEMRSFDCAEFYRSLLGCVNDYHATGSRREAGAPAAAAAAAGGG